MKSLLSLPGLVFVLSLASFLPFTTAEAQETNAPTKVIVGGTAFYDSGRLEGEEQVATQERDESFDFRNDNFLSARILYLRPFSERLYIGGGVDFVGTYRATIVEEEENDSDEPPETYEFGPTLEALAMAEWRIDLNEKIDLGLGANLGLVALFPRSDLDEEIRELQDSNVPVFGGPRPGWALGATVAGVYRIDDRVALRADLGARWQSLFLFATSRTVDGVAFRKSWRTGALRTQLGLALEVSF